MTHIKKQAKYFMSQLRNISSNRISIQRKNQKSMKFAVVLFTVFLLIAFTKADTNAEPADGPPQPAPAGGSTTTASAAKPAGSKLNPIKFPSTG